MKDPELLRLIQEDNPEGLSILYKTFRTEFIQWIAKFSHCSREDAQEFFQATIIIVYDNIKAGKLNELHSSLKTYMFGIGKNLAWNSYRQDLRKQKSGAEFYVMSHVAEEIEDEQSIHESNLELVNQCFRRLGEPCHTLLDLYYYQKRNMDEIAGQLDYKNTDTAKNQKYKCMERLRKMVEEELIRNNVGQK